MLHDFISLPINPSTLHRETLTHLKQKKTPQQRFQVIGPLFGQRVQINVSWKLVIVCHNL